MVDRAEALRVLVVDDEASLRLVAKTMLERQGYRCTTASCGSEALERLSEAPYDCMLTDVRMPGLDGIDLCAAALSLDPGLAVFVMSAFGSIDLALTAIERGAYDYLTKPFRQDELQLTFRKFERKRALDRENAALRAALRQENDWVAASPIAQQVKRVLDKAAEASAPMLLTGAIGVGKASAATYAHQRGRPGTPQVTFECRAVSSDAHSTELFRPGSGLWHQAAKGALLIKHVDVLAGDAQALLVQHLGAARLQEDASAPRLLATSRYDIDGLASLPSMDPALFFAMKVIHVDIPPLRTRVDDIVPLALSLLRRRRDIALRARAATDDGRALSESDPRGSMARTLTLSAAAKDQLRAYAWPGNVSELQGAMDHAFVMAETGRIGPEDLPETLRALPGPVAMVLAQADLSVKRAGFVLEGELIRRALRQTAGNKSAAARLLDLSHRALLYKMRQHQL